MSTLKLSNADIAARVIYKVVEEVKVAKYVVDTGLCVPITAINSDLVTRALVVSKVAVKPVRNYSLQVDLFFHENIICNYDIKIAIAK